MRKLTTEEFIKRAKKIHEDKYDYSFANYKNNYTLIKIICQTHGFFEQIPKDHMKGFGCYKCSGSCKLDNKEFIDKSNIIHNNVYNYSLVNYTGNKIKVKIICKIHGVFFQKPNHHLSGIGCPSCGGTRKMTQLEFETIAADIHDNFYNYSKSKYINSDSKISIICIEHGEFMQKAEKHLKGQGCPKCRFSKGEREIYKFLSKNNIKNIAQYIFLECSFKGKLFFDFYLPDNNICIEYDGIQHFKQVKCWGGENEFKNIQIRDKMKDEFCKKNKIELLRIPYFEFNNINEILNKRIYECRVK